MSLEEGPPTTRSQAKDRHSNFHPGRDNLVASAPTRTSPRLPVPIPGCASGNLTTMAFANSSFQQQDAARLVNPEARALQARRIGAPNMESSRKASAWGPWVGPSARSDHSAIDASGRGPRLWRVEPWRGAPANAPGARCPISPGDSPQLISGGERLASPRFLPSDLATVESCRVFSSKLRRWETPTSSSFCSISVKWSCVPLWGGCHATPGRVDSEEEVWQRWLGRPADAPYRAHRVHR